MALHLITGFAGYEHIKSSDQGAYNIATFGSGNFVFNRGSEFFATVTSNNTINIADGEAMLQGRFIKAETSENVTIENGSQGKTRQDLICIRYEKSASDGTESANLVVIKGEENGSDPEYNNGNITDGTDSVADFPLYRVKLNGITIEGVEQLFEVKMSMKEYMDTYAMPTADREHLGAVSVGDGISVNDGKIGLDIYKEYKSIPINYTMPASTSRFVFTFSVRVDVKDNESLLSAGLISVTGLGGHTLGSLMILNITHSRYGNKNTAEISIGLLTESTAKTLTAVNLDLVWVKKNLYF